MTPLMFEARHAAEWSELEQLLSQLSRSPREVRGERVVALYRRVCEQLALARSRSYPTYLVERLEHLTTTAHQLIYARRELVMAQLRALFLQGFPSTVRRHSRYVWYSLALFAGPMLVLGVLVYLQPELVLSVLDERTVRSFETMYSPEAKTLGRARDAQSDWYMFGIYIRNNIGIAFQCFAAGIFLGLGSIFFLAYNGAVIGAVAGYLTERGMASTFYSFVVTHGAFELTAIVLAGAAGLMLGSALLAPGRQTRKRALTLAAKEAIVIVYGTVVMLVIAAAIEAFWSSSTAFPSVIKYVSAAVCWCAVLAYLCLQGRHADR